MLLDDINALSGSQKWKGIYLVVIFFFYINTVFHIIMLISLFWGINLELYFTNGANFKSKSQKK